MATGGQYEWDTYGIGDPRREAAINWDYAPGQAPYNLIHPMGGMSNRVGQAGIYGSAPVMQPGTARGGSGADAYLGLMGGSMTPSTATAAQIASGGGYLGSGTTGSSPSGYTQTLAQQSSLYNDIIAQYDKLGADAKNQYGDIDKLLQGVEGPQRQAIYDQYVGAQGSANQNAISRGLGNSTIRESMQRGVLYDRTKADNALTSQMSQLKAGYLSSAQQQANQLALAKLGYQGGYQNLQDQLANQRYIAALNAANRNTGGGRQPQQSLGGGGGRQPRQPYSYDDQHSTGIGQPTGDYYDYYNQLLGGSSTPSYPGNGLGYYGPDLPPGYGVSYSENSGNSLGNAIDNFYGLGGYSGYAKGGVIPATVSSNKCMAKGGMATKPTAIVGEGRAPEFVIPTDPKYRKRAIGLLKRAGKAIGCEVE